MSPKSRMPATRAALFACLAALASPAAKAEGLVGRIVPPYPEGLEDLGGSCVSDSADPERVCDYSISVLAARLPGVPGAHAGTEAGLPPAYIVAGRLAGRDGPHARWEITDAAPYPRVAPDYYLQFGTCRVHGQDDARVAAVVRQAPSRQWSKDVAWAGRLELPAGRLAPLDPRAVDCLNEAYYGL